MAGAHRAGIQIAVPCDGNEKSSGITPQSRTSERPHGDNHAALSVFWMLTAPTRLLSPESRRRRCAASGGSACRSR
jgi:hypothetical protein